MPRACKIEGCDKRHYAQGWCECHYKRWRAHGDPLGGSGPRGTSAGSPARFLREVVLAYDGDECLIWPFRKTHDRPQIVIDGKLVTVSRFVCEVAKGPPPTPRYDSAHSCGKGHLGCVTRRHLSWKTRKQNKADELIHGTRNRGERHGNVCLTEEQARKILAMKGKRMQKDIAADLGIRAKLVSQIHRRETWAWL